MRDIHPAYVVWAVLVTLMGLTYCSQQGQGYNPQGGLYGEVDEENLANFPPPDKYQEIGGSVAVVTTYNGSPDRLRIAIDVDGQKRNLEFPACKDCTPYSQENMPECTSVGEPVTYEIPAGDYEVVSTFFGQERTEGFRSGWKLEPGWHYMQCLYTSDEVRFGYQ
jgi:hypothetical protein